MKIPAKDIAVALKSKLQKQVADLKFKGKKPKLLTILLENSPAQLSFVAIKKRIALELGIDFEFKHFEVVPQFPIFLEYLKSRSNDPEIMGIIVQHPLPTRYDKHVVYEQISVKKDIEGHKPVTSYQFPLSLAVLNAIKYIYLDKNGSLEGTVVEFGKDKSILKKILKDKKIVIVGRGITGGAPISASLAEIGVPYKIVHSKSKQRRKLFKEADIIITAVGKEVIKPIHIKNGVILLNVGLRKEEGKLKGDFDSEKVKDIASFYNETPGGLGPLDVLYLYKNLIEAC